MNPLVTDADDVLDDVRRASEQWRLAGGPAPDSGRLRAAVDAALTFHDDPDDARLARFCMVTKGPHLLGALPQACVTARLRAFGVTVHGRVEITGRGADVAAALYPRAVRYFRQGPTIAAMADRLAHRFDSDEFTRIFGRRYDPSLVVAGATAMADNGLGTADFVALWEQGRRPISRTALVENYGVAAADLVLRGESRYDWFRGPLPLGISRIASGMTAFAVRDRRLYGGAPVIVINGHVPGLAALFEPAAWLFDLGIDGDSPHIGAVRRMLAGEQSVPVKCRPGSLRRDGADGNLPLAAAATVDSRHNLVHCSDGLVAALSELRAMRPGRAGDDRLTAELTGAGLTRAEIDRLVTADPRVLSAVPNGHLSDVTCGLTMKETVATVLRLVPPTFGAANGFADGAGLGLLDRAFGQQPPPAPRLGPPAAAVEPTDADEAAGRAAIAAGAVAMLAPAGGTGGRFGGYHLPEHDPRRQKALAPVLTLAGRPRSALDLRLANARFWAGDDRPVPVAVLGSGTGADALRAWRDGQPDRAPVELFWQHGIYRLDRDLAGAGSRWVDAVLRDGDGRPSRKPHGSMGLFSALLISEVFDRWESAGIEYLAVANADDVLFRLDPAVLGHLANRPDIDAVVITMPWAYSATLPADGGDIAVRGDETGWLMDAYGGVPTAVIPPERRRHDAGGAVLIDDGRLWIGEGERPAGALFNTNQLYLRMSALRRLLDGTGTGDRVRAVRRLIAGLPARLEDKTVMIDGTARRARQLSQPLNGLLLLLSRCAVVTGTRTGEQRSGHASLKQPADVRFAQVALDRRAAGDELTW